MIGPPDVLDAFDEGRTYGWALALAMGWQRAVGRERRVQDRRALAPFTLCPQPTALCP